MARDANVIVSLDEVMDAAKLDARFRREDHLVALAVAALPQASERFKPNAVMSGADMDTETRRIGYFAAFAAFAAMKKIDEGMEEWEARSNGTRDESHSERETRLERDMRFVADELTKIVDGTDELYRRPTMVMILRQLATRLIASVEIRQGYADEARP